MCKVPHSAFFWFHVKLFPVSVVLGYPFVLIFAFVFFPLLLFVKPCLISQHYEGYLIT